MSTRTLRNGLLLVLIALGATPVTSAGAVTTVRSDPGGPLLSGSTVITSTTADTAILDHGGVATLTCSNTAFRADLNSRSSATSISGRLTELTFTSCSNFVTPFMYPSGCALHAPSAFPTLNVTAQSGGALVAVTDATLRCPRQDGFNSVCYYTFSSMVSTALNTPSTLDQSPATGAFTAATADATLPQCPISMGLKFRLTHLVQASTTRTITFTTS